MCQAMEPTRKEVQYIKASEYDRLPEPKAHQLTLRVVTDFWKVLQEHGGLLKSHAKEMKDLIYQNSAQRAEIAVQRAEVATLRAEIAAQRVKFESLESRMKHFEDEQRVVPSGNDATKAATKAVQVTQTGGPGPKPDRFHWSPELSDMALESPCFSGSLREKSHGSSPEPLSLFVAEPEPVAQLDPSCVCLGDLQESQAISLMCNQFRFDRGHEVELSREPLPSAPRQVVEFPKPKVEFQASKVEFQASKVEFQEPKVGKLGKLEKRDGKVHRALQVRQGPLMPGALKAYADAHSSEQSGLRAAKLFRMLEQTMEEMPKSSEETPEERLGTNLLEDYTDEYITAFNEFMASDAEEGFRALYKIRRDEIRPRTGPRKRKRPSQGQKSPSKILKCDQPHTPPGETNGTSSEIKLQSCSIQV
jgi:hypothetical protein